ncbi:MAG: universal stress protein [Gammaproteobacteria bacterium]
MSKEISKLLLATDGSEGSLHAASFAATIARSLDAHVTILTVHDDDVLMLHAMGPAVWPAAVPEASLNVEEIKTATERKALETTLADTRAALGGLTNIEVDQTWGHTAEAICDYAKDNSFDMIVIGSRGRSAFARLLLGSVSAQVAHHSPCPVTIVH